MQSMGLPIRKQVFHQVRLAVMAAVNGEPTHTHFLSKRMGFHSAGASAVSWAKGMT